MNGRVDKAALLGQVAGTSRNTNKVVRRRDLLTARATVGVRRNRLTGKGYGNWSLTRHRRWIYSGWHALIEFGLAKHFEGARQDITILETYLRYFLQAAHDYFFEGRWDVLIQLAGRQRGVLNILHASPPRSST